MVRNEHLLCHQAGLADNMSHKTELRCAVFTVWLILSAAILLIMLTPFVASPSGIARLVPECERKKVGQKCAFCGMTSAFFSISKGDFRTAIAANAFSPWLYGGFVLNECLLLVVLIAKMCYRRRSVACQGNATLDSSDKDLIHAREQESLCFQGPCGSLSLTSPDAAPHACL